MGCVLWPVAPVWFVEFINSEDMSLFQWGIVWGENTGKSEHIITPKKFSGPGNLVSVACGTNMTVVVDATGSVYTAGCSNKDGRLGHDGECNGVMTKLSLPSAARAISCGSSSTVVLMQDGTVFGFGKDLGATPVLLNLSGASQLSCGDGYLLYCQSSKVYMCKFADGRLDDVPVDTGIEGDVCSLDAGPVSYSCVTSDGRAYMWGRLPHGGDGDEEKYTKVSASSPRSVAIDGEKITSIVNSRGQFHAHSLALTESGHVYAIGSNYKQKLGHGGSKAFSGSFVRVSSDVKFQCVVAGGIHSSSLTSEGRVCTWGCGSDGRYVTCVMMMMLGWDILSQRIIAICTRRRYRAPLMDFIM